MLILSLFPGLDLLGMAFEQEGFCVVAGPDVCWGRDIRDFHPPEGIFDGVIGGDPCQSHSRLANLVRAKGFEPRFGDLSGEFQRIVEETKPRWFLRENVPRAPDIEPRDYSVTSFLLDNSHIDSGDGFGEEQMRKRRWWFGWPVDRGNAANLVRRIPLAVFELPKRASGVVAGHGEAPGTRDRLKTNAVVADSRAVPVQLGGSGRVKRTAVSQTAVNNSQAAKGRVPCVTGVHQCSHRPKGGHGERYTLADMLRLQGLPEDLLDESPFTMQGKRKLIGNGVPLSMGRALARAVKEVTDEKCSSKPSRLKR